ncbi:MAG: radical SAM protein [Actinobacteria bacterium]|nr:MAG: radical SAM protein [Actinomycetota bacterium]
MGDGSRLVDHLPLDAPWGLAIDPSSRCNYSCRFCPTGTSGPDDPRQRGTMSFETFKHIIDGLASDGIVVRSLKLWKDGEPLLNEDLPRFIRYAKEAGVTEEVRVNTNGSLLDTMAAQLVDAGLDWIMVSYTSPNDEVFREYSGGAFAEKVERNVALLREIRGDRPRPHIAVKICRFPAITDADVEEFKRRFAGIADELIVHEDPMNWDNTGEQDFTLGKVAERERPRMACPYPWYELNVNSDASVSICPVDWSLGTVVGDATQETIGAIWNGERLAELRRMFVTRDFSAHPVCGECTYYHRHDDDIDEFVLRDAARPAQDGE